MPKVSSCPVDTTVFTLLKKWKPAILFQLHKRDGVRFSEFQKLIKISTGRTVTKKMLAQQLRELEEDRIVARIVYPEVPPKVEYFLTDYGRTTKDMMDEIVRWGGVHLSR